MTSVAHPYRLGPTRQLAIVDVDRHIADLVRIVLLTGPGERLHRADFGAGLGAAMLFEPLDDALLSVVEVRARGSLLHALGDRIEIGNISVGKYGSELRAEIEYHLRPAGSEQRTIVNVTGGTT